MTKLTEARANEMMEQGYHCSQVVAEHIAEEFGLDRDFMVKLTSGHGGGCNHGDTCGAISAAIMGLSLKYGFTEYAEDVDQIQADNVRELQARFIEKHGSVLCRDLLNGYDGADPNRVSQEDTWDKCGLYCEDAAAIMDEIIARG